MRTEKAGIMNRTISALALLASLATCKQQESMKASPETLSITDAVVRLAPIESRPAAAYFTIHGGRTPDRLTAVSSSKATSIELHESSMQGGMMSMKPIAGTAIPAGGQVAFKPGGNHGMVFGLDPAVKPGTSIPLHFTFQSGAAIDVDAKALAAGDDMSAQMQH